jgi:uncharacterized membrane protein
MMRIEHSTVIRRPVEDVFAVVSDVAGWPRWNKTARVAHVTSPGPVGLGTTFRLEGTIVGRAVDANHEVTAYKQDHVFAAKTLSGPFLATGTYTFEPVPEGTRVDVVVEGEPAGVARFGAAMLTPAIRKQVETQQGHLKELLEGS